MYCVSIDNNRNIRFTIRHNHKGLTYVCQKQNRVANIEYNIPSGCYFCDALLCDISPDALMEINPYTDTLWTKILYDEQKKTYYHIYTSKKMKVRFECESYNEKSKYICPFCNELSKEDSYCEECEQPVHIITKNDIQFKKTCNGQENCVNCMYDRLSYSLYQKAVFNYFHKKRFT